MDMPVSVPVDNPNADTEWNDILRKHGVIPEKPPSPTPMVEEALNEARRLAHDNRLEGKDLDELDELEDDEDEEFLDHYRCPAHVIKQRKQRLNELSTIAKTSIYNQVYPIQKPEYYRDVTEVSNESFVFVLLTSSLGTNTESGLLMNLWRALASKFGEVKFCQMRADLCIEGYPDKNTPTVLIYKDEDIKRQMVTLKELKGSATGIADMESVLISVGAIKQNDVRLGKRKSVEEESVANRRIRNGKSATHLHDEEDSDWD